MVELRRFFVAWLLVIFVVLFFLLFVPTYFPEDVRSPVRVEEDEPGWDCATMGNRICELYEKRN